MQRLLIVELLRKHFTQIEVDKIVKYEYREKIFNSLLNVLSRRSFCPNCQFCENCEMNLVQEEDFFNEVKSYVQRLFVCKWQ